MIWLGFIFSSLMAIPLAIYFSEKTKLYFFPFFLLFFAIIPANLFCALLLPFIGWNWKIWLLANVIELLSGVWLLGKR